ncbi:MAG: hypothetical protein GY729_21525 [Desulfobacteraceae bacterium]|nr:hypothetical protein [Desulfobacteraceae bacterium]
MSSKPLWQEDSITLIGRRSLLERQIKPRVNNPSLRFLLVGESGAGRTALLEAAFKICNFEKKSLISCKENHSEICKKIIADWELDVDCEKSKPTVVEMEQAIFGESGHIIFVDDVQRATSAKKLDFFKVLAERHKVCGTMQKGTARAKIKPLLGMMGKEIKVSKLNRVNSLKMAERVCVHLSSNISHIDVANNCKGLPSKIVNFARTNEIIRNEIRSQDEEIDIAPFFLMFLACIVVFRYIGRAMQATDFVLLGGVGMVFLIFARGFLLKGRDK